MRPKWEYTKKWLALFASSRKIVVQLYRKKMLHLKFMYAFSVRSEEKTITCIKISVEKLCAWNKSYQNARWRERKKRRGLKWMPNRNSLLHTDVKTSQFKVWLRVRRGMYKKPWKTSTLKFMIWEKSHVFSIPHRERIAFRSLDVNVRCLNIWFILINQPSFSCRTIQ